MTIYALGLITMFLLCWQLFGLAILIMDNRDHDVAVILAATLLGPLILPLRWMYRFFVRS